MAEVLQNIGWRKLAAWLLCFGLFTYATIVAMAVHGETDIPVRVLDGLKWTTGFFFVSNAAEHFIKGNATIKVGGQ